MIKCCLIQVGNVLKVVLWIKKWQKWATTKFLVNKWATKEIKTNLQKKSWAHYYPERDTPRRHEVGFQAKQACIKFRTIAMKKQVEWLKRMKKLTIKDLPKHGRPREKLKEKGAGALTDQELVTAILGSAEKQNIFPERLIWKGFSSIMGLEK